MINTAIRINFVYMWSQKPSLPEMWTQMVVDCPSILILVHHALVLVGQLHAVYQSLKGKFPFFATWQIPTHKNYSMCINYTHLMIHTACVSDYCGQEGGTYSRVLSKQQPYTCTLQYTHTCTHSNIHHSTILL